MSEGPISGEVISEKIVKHASHLTQDLEDSFQQPSCLFTLLIRCHKPPRNIICLKVDLFPKSTLCVRYSYCYCFAVRLCIPIRNIQGDFAFLDN